MNTGPTLLTDDIGELSYNGITFNILYTSSIRGVPVQDAAARTTKYVEYTITVDGVITKEDEAGTIDSTWEEIRRRLDEHAGVLKYLDKGFGHFAVNVPGSAIRDVKWGPVPKTLEFIPLGGGRAARIIWTVTTCLPESAQRGFVVGSSGRFIAPGARNRAGTMPVLQFNYDTTVSYDEDGYSRLAIRGVLEIPLTRVTRGDRQTLATADQARDLWIRRLTDSFDLTRFRVVQRNFPVSRDKRTLEFDFALEELPPMVLPTGMLTAHGSYTVKPSKVAKILSGSVSWICTLRGSYVVPKNLPRRTAWNAFMSLVMYRLSFSELGTIPPAGRVAGGGLFPSGPPSLGPTLGFDLIARVRTLRQARELRARLENQRAWLFHLGVDEGLYLDSKSISFEAAWTLMTTYETLLVAAGVWMGYGGVGRDISVRAGPGAGPSTFVAADTRAAAREWATSVRGISGHESWLRNELDPRLQAIVDFGGGGEADFGV